ncbi:MAG: Uma2 family endonuclease [Planctomycetes bacterium]|nr:Uma2 family endonuclease [Planctomycetota bacterium]
MGTITVYDLEIPEGVGTLDGFRRWVATLAEPAPRVHYCKGRVDIQMSPQNYESHAPVVCAINRVLIERTEHLELGRYFVPPSWVTVENAGLSTEPDGFMVRWDRLRSGAVRVNPEQKSELVGRPDMVMEVVSQNSVRKDQVELLKAYAEAGIPEYWLVDARAAEIDLRIFVLGEHGRYRAQRRTEDGWVISKTWNAAFRLRRFSDRAGMADFRLETRPALGADSK